MPIHNVVDERSNKFVVRAMAIFERSWHDNSCDGATQFPTPTDDQFDAGDLGDGPDYLCIACTTVDRAIRYAAQEWPLTPITLFLSDADAPGNYVDHATIEEGPDGVLFLGVPVNRVNGEPAGVLATPG